jgi:hypothetical protein
MYDISLGLQALVELLTAVAVNSSGTLKQYPGLKTINEVTLNYCINNGADTRYTIYYRS